MSPWPLLHREATAELRAAIRWYEDRREGLGRRFYERVETTAMRVMRGELPGMPVETADTTRNLRRVRVPRFPYMLYFESIPAGTAFVAIAHMSRRPGYFTRRRPEDAT